MKREEKQLIIGSLTEQLQQYPHFYLVDSTGLNAEETAKFRRSCFENEVKMVVVKNTFFRNALQSLGKEGTDELTSSLVGTTAVLFTTVGNAPAKMLKEWSKTSSKLTLKAAYVEECTYVGAENLDALVAVKSRDELIADVVALLQSPAKNVISALQSGGQTLSGLVKTLSERE